MRTLWKGAISFGLVNVPVRMFTATQRNEIKFNYLHKKCGSPIRYVRFCPVCETEVQTDDIVWGYEYQKGRFVVLNEEDFERLPDENNHTVDILDFVDLGDIDPIYFDKSYYLEPNEGGEKAYALLVRAMKETGKVAVARVIIRTKETLAALRAWNDTIVMETMFYAEEVRRPETIGVQPREVKLHDNEVKMAVSLVGNLSTRFEPQKYENNYRKALRELIEARITGEQITAPRAAEPGKVVDLMEALKASLAAFEPGGNEAAAEKRPRRRKAAAP